MKRISVLIPSTVLLIAGVWSSSSIFEKTAQAARQLISSGNQVFQTQAAGLPDFDIRASVKRSQPLEERTIDLSRDGFSQGDNRRRLQERVSRSNLRRRSPQLQIRWSSLTGAPSRVVNLQGAALSDPTRPIDRGSAIQRLDRASDTARGFLRENRDLFGLDDAEINSLEVGKRYVTEHNGSAHVTLGQSLDGIAVFQAAMSVNLKSDGSVMSASGELFHGLKGRPDASIQVEEGLRLASQAAGTSVSANIGYPQAPSGANRAQRLTAGFARDVDAQLVYFPITSDEARMAWQFQIWRSDTPDAYLILIDAENGALLYRYNFTSYDENPLHPHGLIFNAESPTPHNPYSGVDNPSVVPQVDLPFRAETFLGTAIFGVSDPHYDWWAGGQAIRLVSNNVNAHLDRDGIQNSPDSPILERLDGNFSFTADLTASPTLEANASAAQVNLFYFVNRYHDILYKFGFTESAGNFQANNFGLGGIAFDAIQADAQDGGGFNNANFSTPPDGSSGRVQMYLWDAFNPDLDGDFDQGVIVHELTHGLSNRLVGNANGLSGMQARGMGEGWSDYFALTLLRTAGENPDGSYPIGQYVVRRYAAGIRRYPYSTSLSTNPLTFARIMENTESHAVGEVWCSLLWEMRRLLVEKYGFLEGQRQSIQLVVDGLKLTPAAPTFLDARDAIMLADRINNGGANLCLIGKAFAKRGAGFNASTTDSNDAAPVESFAEASYCSDTGTIALDRKNYLPGETISVTLGDRNGPATPTVEIRSTVTGDSLTLPLNGQSNVPGSYSGAVATSIGRATAGDGVLQVSPDLGDQIRVAYSDSSTANGAAGESIGLAGAAREADIFTDDVEHGSKGWIPNGTWAVSPTMSASSSHSWAVRATGNDQYLPVIALTSPTFDLSNYTDVTLNFAQSFDLFNAINYGIIEYSIDDGANWSRVRSFTGSHIAFDQATVRLSGLDGRKFGRVRFVLQNASTSTTNFWAVDDIALIGRSSSTLVIPATLAESPTIASIVPASGPPAGNTLVRITGMNFTESGDTMVSFDGVPATQIDVLGETTLTARVPAHAAGPVIVRVTTRRGSSARASAFTYFQPGTPPPSPTISQIFPTSGSNRGGGTIAAFGSGFTPESVVFFGTTAAQTIYVDAHELHATIPSSASAGSVNVQVNNGGQQATLNAAFTYTAPTPPLLQLIGPNSSATVFAGSTLSITWSSADNRALARHRLFLQYASGIGTAQTEIVTELPGASQSYNWQIPQVQPVTTLARIHIIATDDEGAETEVVSSTDFAIAQRWERTRVLPAALYRTQVASDGTALYLFGGRAGTSDANTISNLFRYDPATNAWSSFGLAAMPQGINGGDAAVLLGRVFVPGGASTGGITSNHYAYDFASNNWVSRAASTTPVSLYSLAVNSEAGVFYLAGGNSGGAVASARVYDVNANSWSELPAMSTARYGHKAVYIDGKLYVAGGIGAAGGLSSCEVFDTVTKQWSPIASLNRPRSGATAFITKGPGGNPLWVLVGGTNPTNGTFLGAECYDVLANRWISLDNSYSLGTQRSFLAGTKVGEFFYALGGANTTQPLNAAERIRADALDPVMANSPPILSVPEFVPVLVGDELRLSVSANDLGAGQPLLLGAADLPPGASFSTTTASNNSVLGTLTWTPGEGDKGKSFTVKFNVNDGQFSDARVTRLVVVEASSLAVVSAADYHSGPMSADSIAAAFGNDLALRTEVAQAVPLPFELAGTEVFVNGLPAQLLFVSAQQVNFVLPPGLAPGNATVILRSATSRYAAAKIVIERSTPALFTTNQNGTGDAAALATTDGVHYQSAPFDLTIGGQANILVLFGTGFRHAVAPQPFDENGVAESVSVTIDGKVAPVYYVGAQGQFVGLDQLNVGFPPGLGGGPQRRLEVVVSVNGTIANRVTIEVK